MKSKPEILAGMSQENREGYLKRLETASGTLQDPYQFDDNAWSPTSFEKWPPMKFNDLHTYLIHTPSEFTHEAIKAYRSEVEAYNYFVSGHVQNCVFAEQDDGEFSFFRSLVLPGQRQNPRNDGDLYDAWVCLHRSGRVQTAACTCMAGLGTACSHVGAILYYVEATLRLLPDEPSITSLPCQWKIPKKKVNAAPLSMINFSRPKADNPNLPAKRRRQQEEEEGPVTHIRADDFDELKEIAPEACVFTLHEDSSDTDRTDSASEDGHTRFNEPMPEPLTYLFDIRNQDLSQEELEAKVEEVVRTLSKEFTRDAVTALEAATVGQANNPVWHEHRAGRVTASRAKELYTLKETTNPDRLVAQIMGYTGAPPDIPALKWGREKESVAVEEFKKYYETEHDNLTVDECGMLVFRELPFMAATPDRAVKCCCGGAVLEVKCPYSLRESSVAEAMKSKKDFCLAADGQLKKNHAYYFQVQFQLMCCTDPTAVCLFMVWTPQDFQICEVAQDLVFIDNMKRVMSAKYLRYVLPEVLTRRNDPMRDDSDKDWCTCKRPRFGKMVRCGKPECAIGQYHLSCLTLRRLPSRIWFCDDCRGRSR